MTKFKKIKEDAEMAEAMYRLLEQTWMLIFISDKRKVFQSNLTGEFATVDFNEDHEPIKVTIRK